MAININTMNTIRENLLTDIIHRYGFEHRITISFSNRCTHEPMTSAATAALVHLHDAYLALPIDEEEDY